MVNILFLFAVSLYPTQASATRSLLFEMSRLFCCLEDMSSITQYNRPVVYNTVQQTCRL